MLHAFTLVGRWFKDVLAFAIGAPLVTWPRHFWSETISHRGVRMVACTLPLLLLAAVLWTDHFIARIDAVPSRLPQHILGMDGPQLVAKLRAARTLSLVFLAQGIYLRDGVVHILGQASGELTLLVLGCVIWVELLLVSTFLLAPVHVMMLNPMLQLRFKNMTARMSEPFLKSWDQVCSVIADKRHLWFVGTEIDRNQPMFLNLQVHRTTWVLGGLDRRSAALPLLSELRAAVQSGAGVLFIDTVDNAGLAAELETFARAAHREGDFHRMRVNAGNAAAFDLDVAEVQRRGRVVYVGLPTQERSLDVQEAAKRTLNAVRELARQCNDEDPNALVVAIQDARELPAEAFAALSQETGLRLLIAQQNCDSEHLAQLVASLRARVKHLAICLAVPRGIDASNLAHALAHVSGRRKEGPSAVAGTEIIQSLRRNEAYTMLDGALSSHVLRLNMGNKMQAKKRNRSDEEPLLQA